MATYRLKADAYKKYATYKWNAGLVFACFVTAAILCSNPKSFWVARYPRLAAMLPHFYAIAVIGAIFSFGFIFGFYYGPKAVKTLEIQITPEGVLRSGGGAPDLFLPWEDITGYAVRKHSIVIQTTDPTRNLAVSFDFDRHEEIQMELASKGISEAESNRARSFLRNPGLLVALSSIILLLLGQTLGHAFASGNLSVAVGVGFIGYIGYRNQFRRRSRTLFVLLLFLAAEIVMLFPRSRGNVWELSYLALNGALALVAYGVSAFRENHP